MGVGVDTVRAGVPQGWLRRARIAFAVVFLGGLGWAFLDLANRMSSALIGALTWPQFVPSALRWVAAPGLAAAGFFAVLGMTLVFGRVYCSAICPLGVLQDLFIRASRWLGWAGRYRYARPMQRAALLVFAIGVVLLSLGYSGLFGFLDPFSAFGRLVGDLARPVLVAANNVVAGFLGSFGIYRIYRVSMGGASIGAAGFSLALLLLPLVLSLRRGRLYCNLICPVGTLLGLVSRWSLFRVRIDRGACVKCGDCISVCKAECIDLKKGAVDAARCVACFNCLSVCPEAGVRYGMAVGGRVGSAEGSVAPDAQGRREFLGVAMAVAGGASFVAMPARAAEKKGVSGDALKAAAAKPSRIPEVKHFPVSPPGSGGIARFNRLCTGCRLCVTACPSHVLRPAVREYGLAGFLQPHMDFGVSFCEYDCNRCGDVCPTGAILPLAKDAKRLVQVGRVVFTRDNCVVQSANTACGSCAEHCPTQAVHMVPFKDNLTIPEIDVDRCVGCGACEHVCPTRPYRAIYVDGNPEHMRALPPTKEKVDQTVPKDFPF